MGLFLSDGCKLALSCFCAIHGSPLPPSLRRQHKAMRDWRQSDVLQFILPESLRMLSVPHERSDESRLSVRHLEHLHTYYTPCKNTILYTYYSKVNLCTFYVDSIATSGGGARPSAQKLPPLKKGSVNNCLGEPSLLQHTW